MQWIVAAAFDRLLWCLDSWQAGSHSGLRTLSGLLLGLFTIEAPDCTVAPSSRTGDESFGHVDGG